jgi:hypothetical protein
MHNLTEQEIQELLEMGINPSSVVSAYDQADFGTFVNNTVGKVKNFVTGTPGVNPAAPSQGGTAFSLAGGSGSSVFNTGAPLQVQRPTQPTQYTMTPNNAPNVSTPTGTPSLMQRLSSGVETGFDKLEEKYKDKIVDKDGKAQAFKMFDKPMQGLMAGLSYGAGMNQAAQVQEQNRMANQSPFREAGNTKEYYNHDFVGENDPLYFLNSRDGAKAEPMYAANGVPIEAEGGEFYLDPSTGATIPIQGPSHEEGGVKMVAKAGSYIMSDNVKIPGSYVNDMLKKNVLSDKKQYTISDVIRQFPQHFDTKGDAEKLNDKALDPISKNSFEMNMKKKLGNVSKLLAYQQTMNGGHGEDKGPEARYGMEINGGAPLSFDYRPDELRVQDMQQTQQMPMAKGGTKNTPPKFKTKEEADAYYKQNAPTNPQQKELFHKELEAAIKRGDKRFTFSGNKLPYEAKEDPNYNTGRMKGVGNSILEMSGTNLTPEQYNTYYGINPSSKELLISPRGAGAIGSFENTLGTSDASGKPIGMGQKDDYALTGGTTNPQIYNQIEDFAAKTIGTDTWNKMPDELKTQMYSFAFNHGIDTPQKQQHLLSGLAQAVGQSTPGSTTPAGLAYRQGLSSDEALKIIKGANLADENVLNNYINVLGDQYGTLAQSQPEAYRATMAGRARDIHRLYGEGKSSTQAEKIGNEYLYPEEGVQSTIRSIQNTGKAGYDAINMGDQKFRDDFKRRHPDVWQKYGMDNWKAEDFLNESKVLPLQKDLNAKGFHIKEDGKWGSETFQVPGVKGNTPTVDKMTLPTTPETPETPPITPPKKNPPYKERLPLGQYMGLLPSPRTQNYLPEYRQERYEPNLVSLRSAKNDQVAAMNSMLQQQGMNPATMSARQASLYGEAAKNIGAITEQENNTNAQILNQAKAQNAQMANQTNMMQQNANKQYVTENAQDLAALDNDRYKKLSDLYSAQQKVNQYNKTLQFIDDNMAKNMNLTVDSDGNLKVGRNEEAVTYDPGLAQATAKTQGLAGSVESSKTTNTNTTNPSTTTTTNTTGENANETPGSRLGGKNKNYRMLY